MRNIVLLASLALTTLVSAAQQPQPPNDIPTLHTSAHLVVLDVVVTDPKGQPVPNLKASDFNLREDGVPQRIGSFTEHTPNPVPTHPAQPLPPNTFSNAPANLTDQARTVLLFDAANTNIQSQMFARQEILKYLKAHNSTTPFAAFLLDTQLHLLHGFDDDPTQFDEAAFSKRLKPESSVLTPGNIGRNYIKEQFRLDALHAALQSLARYLSAFPGRKNLIWITSEVPLYTSYNIGPDPFRDLATFTDTLSGETDILTLSRVAIYPIDARGLTTDPRFSAANGGIGNNRPGPFGDPTFRQTIRNQALDDFARSTGGKAFYNTNGIAEAMDEIVNTGSRYYTLSYTPTNHDWNGRYRNIQLHAGDRNYKLDYRPGYTARDTTTSIAKNDGVIHAYTTATTNGKPVPQPPPPPDTVHQVMDLGAIAPFQIAFQAHITPDAAVLDHNALKTTPSYLQGKWQKGPARPYHIHYDIAPNGVHFTPHVSGQYTGNLQIIAVLYDDLGEVVNSSIATAPFELSAADYSRILQSAIGLDQTLLIPTKGNYYLRLGIHDLSTDRMGALEIPTESIHLTDKAEKP